MKFSNTSKLPAPMFHALTWDTYTKGKADISVTELLKPPRQRLLAKRHDADITINASQNLWSLMGRSTHNVLREAAKSIKGGFNGLTEERLFVGIDGPKGKWMLSGEFDLLYVNEKKELVLSDYKVTGVFGILLEERNGFVKPEWAKQLNIYRWMLHEHGFDVERLEIGAILRDWTASKTKTDPKYPKEPIMIIEVPMWSLKEVEAYVKERVAVHQLAEDLSDDELAACTPDERWERGEKWAVMQAGKKRAFRLFDNEHEAQDCATEVGGRVEHRPGVSAKCNTLYCYGAPWCDFFKGLSNGNGDEKESGAVAAEAA